MTVSAAYLFSEWHAASHHSLGESAITVRISPGTGIPRPTLAGFRQLTFVRQIVRLIFATQARFVPPSRCFVDVCSCVGALFRLGGGRILHPQFLGHIFRLVVSLANWFVIMFSQAYPRETAHLDELFLFIHFSKTKNTRCGSCLEFFNLPARSRNGRLVEVSRKVEAA